MAADIQTRFSPGPDHRRGTRGRPNPLNDPKFAKAVAQAFVDGNTRQQMAEMFGVKDLDTITRWRRDARVKTHALKLIEDRVLQVTRKVDAEIAKRLENPEDMTNRELIDIRKEYMGGALRKQTEKADDETINEAADWLEENPHVAEELAEIVRGKKK
jgi:transposase-like protein